MQTFTHSAVNESNRSTYYFLHLYVLQTMFTDMASQLAAAWVEEKTSVATDISTRC